MNKTGNTQPGPSPPYFPVSIVTEEGRWRVSSGGARVEGGWFWKITILIAEDTIYKNRLTSPETFACWYSRNVSSLFLWQPLAIQWRGFGLPENSYLLNRLRLGGVTCYCVLTLILFLL